MAKAPKKFALDIWKTLAAIDNRNLDYYNNLSTEERKGFHSPVVMRWVSTAQGDAADWNLLAINERANMHHFDLYEHPELQYKLMASVGMGRAKHDWIPNAGVRGMSAPLLTFLRGYYPQASNLEMQIILRHLCEGDNLADFLDGTGLAPDEIKRVKKLFA